MRIPRSRLLRKTVSQFVHITSKLHHREPWWDDQTKESLRKMIWKTAEFSGVRILTYCLMSNHFHILLEIPPKGTLATDEELMRRYCLIHPKSSPYVSRRPEVMEAHLKNNSPHAPRIRRMLQGRMHDASEFAKSLKQKIALFLKNGRPGRGPVWDGRFHSSIIQPLPFALQTVAAYIDLNPVRAGLVADPKDYRFCGYAEALAGSQSAVSGLHSVVETHGAKQFGSNRKLLSAYRLALICKGSASQKDPSDNLRIHPEITQKTRSSSGDLPLPILLRHRLRWIAQGGVIGSQNFVREWLDSNQSGLRRGRVTRSRTIDFENHGISWSRRLRGSP